MIIGIISGYFNPLHEGHLDYMWAAKRETEFLIAIVNSDLQVKLKGSIPFMDEKHRAAIVSSIKWVDSTWISIDTDKTVCRTLEQIHAIYKFHESLSFYNSGDRFGENLDTEETKLCQKLGIHSVFLKLPKKYSSSELIRKAALEV